MIRDNGPSSTRRHADRLLALGGSMLVHGIAVAAIVAFAGGAAEDAPAPPSFTMALEWVAAPSGEPARETGAGGATSDSTTHTTDAAPSRREPPVESSEPATETIAALTAATTPAVTDEAASAVAAESPPRETQPSPAKIAADAKPKPAPSRRSDEAKEPTAAVVESATTPPGDSAASATTTGAVAPSSPGRAAGERAAWSVTARTPPAYPLSARRRGIEGEVSLRVDVDSDGKPRAVAIKRGSGDRQLDEAAARAVEQWRFAVAAPLTIEIPIQFRLNGNSLAATQP